MHEHDTRTVAVEQPRNHGPNDHTGRSRPSKNPVEHAGRGKSQKNFFSRGEPRIAAAGEDAKDETTERDAKTYKQGNGVVTCFGRLLHTTLLHCGQNNHNNTHSVAVLATAGWLA